MTDSLDRDALKDRAAALGIEHARNITTERLAELVAQRLAEMRDAAAPVEPAEPVVVNSLDAADPVVAAAVADGAADEALAAPVEPENVDVRPLLDGKPIEWSTRVTTGPRYIQISVQDGMHGDARGSLDAAEVTLRSVNELGERIGHAYAIAAMSMTHPRHPDGVVTIITRENIA